MQTDPVGYQDDLDLYAYVGNDPGDRTDPSGLCDDPACMARTDARVQEIAAQDPDFDKKATAVGIGVLAVASCAVGCEGLAVAALANPATTTGVVVGAAEIAAGPAMGPGGSLVSTAAQEVKTVAAGVSLAKSVDAGLVRAGGKLANVLGGIESGVASAKPTTGLQAADVVQRAATQAGLDVGVASVGRGG